MRKTKNQSLMRKLRLRMRLRMKERLSLKSMKKARRPRLSLSKFGNGKPLMRSRPSGSETSLKSLRTSTTASIKLFLRITKIL